MLALLIYEVYKITLLLGVYKKKEYAVFASSGFFCVIGSHM